MDERLQRTAAAAREIGADWAVLASIDAVTYATGHVVPIEVGPSPFAGGPTLALVSADGVAGIVCANVESAAAASSRVDHVVIYEGYTWDHGVGHVDAWRDAVRTLVDRLDVGGRIAGERGFFPPAILDLLPAEPMLDITPPLRRARSTKTEAELAQLARSAEAVVVGQTAFLRGLRAGRSELSVFADIRCAIEEFAGARVPIAGDFLSGPARTGAASGWPTARIIEPGDPVLADLAPRIDGYWGDSCAATCAGRPPPGFDRMFETAKGALAHALGIIRPGLSAAALDAELRAFVGRQGFSYSHHSGHGIGTAVHEFPRLVPYEMAVLEPDMVLMVEPGCYDPEVGGVRCEYMIRVTRTGCEVMRPFDHVPHVDR